MHRELYRPGVNSEYVAGIVTVVGEVATDWRHVGFNKSTCEIKAHQKELSSQETSVNGDKTKGSGPTMEKGKGKRRPGRF